LEIQEHLNFSAAQCPRGADAQEPRLVDLPLQPAVVHAVVVADQLLHGHPRGVQLPEGHHAAGQVGVQERRLLRPRQLREIMNEGADPGVGLAKATVDESKDPEGRSQ
jgi:hypothetical protein